MDVRVPAPVPMRLRNRCPGIGSALPWSAVAALGTAFIAASVLLVPSASAYTKETHVMLGAEAAMALPAGTAMRAEILFYLGAEEMGNCAVDPDNGTRILEGIWEEDCLSELHFFHHFWDPDTNNGLPGIPGETAYDRAIEQFNFAVTAYVVGDKDTAYYTLGRVAHLLQDMAQPAHVHLDIHGPFDFTDNYEPGAEDIATDYVYDAPTGSMGPDLIAFLGGYPLTPIDQWNLPFDIPFIPDYGTSFIRRLFAHQAEATDFFESEDREQDLDPVYFDIPSDQFASATSFDGLIGHGTSVAPPEAPQEFTSTEIRKHADVLLPLSIRYVAALFELFWEVTHAGGQSLLDLSMTASPDPVRPGEVLTFATTVTNRGESDVAGVELRLQLPDHIESFSETGTGGDCPSTVCSSGETIVFSLGTLPAGRSRTIVLGTTVAQGFDEPTDGEVLQSSAWATDGSGREVSSFTLTTADSAPALTLGITEDRDPVAPGEVLEYTLTYANAGPISLFGGELQVSLPDGTTFVSASHGGTLASDQVEWDLGTLDVGESGHRTLRVLAGEGLDDGDILTATAAVSELGGAGARATVSTAVAAAPALALAMTAAPDPVRPGQVLTYTLTVSNRSGADVAGVELRQQLPSYVESLSESGTGGDCPSTVCSSGETIAFGLGTLPAGGSRTVVLGLVVATGFNQPDDNALILSDAAVTESSGTGASATAVALAHATPRLALGVFEDRDPAAPGEVLEYLLTYANAGPISLFTAGLQTTLPSGASFLSASDGGTVAGDRIEWDLGTLAVGESGHRVLRVLVDAAAADGDFLTTAATVHDGGTRSARASAATAVDSSPGLALAMAVSPDPARPGQVASHTLTVTNRGAADLAGVELRQVLPSHIESFSESGTGGDCPSTVCSIGESIVFSLGTLSAGQSRTVLLGPRLALGFDEAQDNSLIVGSAAVTESAGTGATASAAILAHSAPSLTVGIVEDRDPVRPGENLDYALTYANTGAISLFGGRLQATLPVGVSFVSASHGGSLSGDQVEWDLGTLSVSESGHRSLRVQVSPTASDGDLLRTTAIIADNPTRGARAVAVTAVDSSPRLELSMSASPEPVQPGQVLTFSMTATNRSAGGLAGVELRQLLPSHIESFSESGTGGDCPSTVCTSGETIVFPLGTLLAAESRTVTLDTTVAQGFDEPADGVLILGHAAVSDSAGGQATAASVTSVDASGLPPTCSAPDDLTVSDTDIVTPTVFEACVSITVGPSVEVRAPLTLRADLVRLRNGVTIDSDGTLVVESLPGSP